MTYFTEIISQNISEGFILKTSYSSERSQTSGNYPKKL